MYYLIESRIDLQYEEDITTTVVLKSENLATLQARLHELFKRYLSDSDTEMVNGVFNPKNDRTAEYYEEQCDDAALEWDGEADDYEEITLWPPEEKADRLSIRCCSDWAWGSVEYINYMIISDMELQAIEER